MTCRPPGNALQRRQQISLVRSLARLGLHQAQEGWHHHQRDGEIHHDADGRPDPERPDGHHVAHSQRQHSQRRGRARAEQGRGKVRDGVLERMLRIQVTAFLVPVLHDVDVVRDGEHDDERDDHAGQHVVGEAEQRVQPQRPEHAHRDRDERQQRFPERAKRDVDRQYRQQDDRRGECPLIVEGDAVVGFADLQAAVVVGAHTLRQRRIHDVVDLLDDAGPNGVDPILVEADNQRRDPRIVGDEVAADQIVLDGTPPQRVRAAGAREIDQRPHLETVRNGVDDRRGGQAVHPLDRVHPLDVPGNLLDGAQRSAREQPLGESASSAMISVRYRRTPHGSVRSLGRRGPSFENHALMSLSMLVMFARGAKRTAPTMQKVVSGYRHR